MNAVDSYRVTLFKNKIRASIPGGEGIRFRHSHDGSHLIIELFMPYYGKEQEVSDLITKHLKRGSIDHIVKTCPWTIKILSKKEREKPWCIAIPVDQEALPERKKKRVN